MFLIHHNKHIVYSLIKIRKVKLPINENLIRQLMFIWANETAIPYIEWMRRFKTDETKWYLK